MTKTDLPLVVHADARPGQDMSREEAPLAEVGAVLRTTRAQDEDELIANLRDADVVLVSAAPITRPVMESLPRCRGVVRYGVGVDNVDLVAATDVGIVVAHVPGFCTEEVATHALLFLLAHARKLTLMDRRLHDGVWRGEPPAEIPTVYGQTLGIIGLGRIGRSLARKAEALGMNVIACDPYIAASDRMQSVPLISREDVLRASHYVSLNVPLTDETFHLIGERELALMKPTAILINTARGRVVEEEALVKALREQRIAGAALDVFEVEPLPGSSPLREFDNVILTPHWAGVSERSVQIVRTEVGEAAAALLAGRWPRHVANQAVQPRVPLK